MITGIGNALIVIFKPLLLPTTLGFDDTTLILYAVPLLIEKGMAHVIVPELTEVIDPMTLGEVNEPN